jgi:hypothetical protein
MTHQNSAQIGLMVLTFIKKSITCAYTAQGFLFYAQI